LVLEKELYIDGQKVIKGYESFSGWHWFATEEAYKQDSILPNGKEVPDIFGPRAGTGTRMGIFFKGRVGRPKAENLGNT
jgi:hypothetical protein